MAKFISKVPTLTLQDGVSEKEAAAGKTGVWAEFVDGEFETNEKTVIARLKKVKGVAEVKGGKAADDSDADKNADDKSDGNADDESGDESGNADSDN